MKILTFTNTSFVLYQIFPDHKKIDFLDQAFDGDIPKIAERLYQVHFEKIVEPSGDIDIDIISYITPEGGIVNIFCIDDILHINSNRLREIRHLVESAFYEGNILILDTTYKKTRTNRDRYHLRFYRAYKKINDDDDCIPLNMS